MLKGAQRGSRVRRAATGVGAVMALVAAGCGDDEANPPPTTRTTMFKPPAPVNNEEIAEGTGACGLLNQGEVEAAITLPVEAGSGVRTKSSESCKWALRSGANQFVAVISSANGQQSFKNAEEALAGGVEPVSGVGDRAFVARDTVYALKGTQLILVEVLTSQPVPTRRDAAIKLAQTAIPRA